MLNEYVKVATLADVPPNKLKAVKAGGKEICLINFDGSIIALSNICTHLSCELSENGEIEDGELACGCHGSRFKLPGGEVAASPARNPLQRFNVRIDGQDVLVSVSLGS